METSAPGVFAKTGAMQKSLGNTRRQLGRNVRFHCNEVRGAVPIDMTSEADYTAVFSAYHYFKYASGVYGTWSFVQRCLAHPKAAGPSILAPVCGCLGVCVI